MFLLESSDVTALGKPHLALRIPQLLPDDRVMAVSAFTTDVVSPESIPRSEIPS